MEKDLRDKKKLTAFRIDPDVRVIADNLIVHRAVRKHIRPENFSLLLRNLILEAWEREKKMIEADKEKEDK